MSMPQVGQPAPDFELPNEKGEIVRLSDKRGQPVILFFYPKDDTPGCTAEVCNLRDDYSQFRQAGIVLLGISADPVKSHAKFQRKYSLPFSLLADVDTEVCQAYGVWVTKKLFGREYMGIARTTFAIDAQGVISHVFEGVDPEIHSRELLTSLGAATG